MPSIRRFPGGRPATAGKLDRRVKSPDTVVSRQGGGHHQPVRHTRRMAPHRRHAPAAEGGGRRRRPRRPGLVDLQRQHRPARARGRRPWHRGRRHVGTAAVGAVHRRRGRGGRHPHRRPSLPGLPRGPLGREAPARPAVRPRPAPALRLPRRGPGRSADEPGQHRSAAAAGLRGADPADHRQPDDRRQRHRHPVDHRSGARRAGPGHAAAHQRGGQAVRQPPVPVRDGRPAGVRRAGRGRRGVRGRRPRRQGLRRRVRRARSASHRSRRRLSRVDGRSPHPGRVPAGTRAAAQHRPHHRAVRGRSPGDRGVAQLGSFVLFNFFVVLLVWPLRMLGMVIAYGTAGLGSSHRVAEVLSTDPVIVDRPGARSLPEGRGQVHFDHVDFSYGDGTIPGAVRLRAHHRSGYLGGPRRRHRMRQVHGGSPAAPLLRRRRRAGPARRRRRARRARRRAASLGRHGVRGDLPVLRHHRRQHRLRRPGAPHEAIERGRSPGRRPRLHRGARPRLRLGDRRARLLAVGRSAPAHRHRPGHPRRPPRADPRRRHLVGRPHQGARDPRRAGRGHGGPHHDRDRPPGGHHRAGRPRRAPRRGAGPGHRHPRGAAGHQRAVPRGAGRRRPAQRPAPGWGPDAAARAPSPARPLDRNEAGHVLRRTYERMLRPTGAVWSWPRCWSSASP